MKLRLKQVLVNVASGNNRYGVQLSFEPGLTIVRAANSSGKSTVFRCILYALGLEGMLSPRDELPLTDAVRTQLSDGTALVRVDRSEVLLVVQGVRGQTVVVRRTIVGAEDTKLIRIYPTDSIDGVLAGEIVGDPYYVRRNGAATEQSGFHRWLEDFIGWKLPAATTYDNRETRLYLEYVFPYLMVEQTKGWSSFPARIPTHLQVRNPVRRTVEFLLGLESNLIELRRIQLQVAVVTAERDWREQVARLNATAESIGAVAKISPTPKLPVNVAVLLPKNDGETWVALSDYLSETVAILEKMNERSASSSELDSSLYSEALEELQHREQLLQKVQSQIGMERLQLASIRQRIDSLREDLRQHLDLRTLQSVGAESSKARLASNCSTCGQSLPTSLMPRGAGPTMDVEQNVKFIRGQIEAYQSLANATDASLSAATVRMLLLNDAIAESQARIRAIRSDLRRSDNSISETEIDRKLRLSQFVERAAAAQSRNADTIRKLEEIALRWTDASSQITDLPKGQFSGNDLERIQRFEQLLRSLLVRFDFRSIAPRELSVSPDGFGVESDGFSVNASISASDNIRLIWAYLISLFSLSSAAGAMHPGILVFDEPKQQAVEDRSFDALIDVLSERCREHRGQVIVFTSEPIARLAARPGMNRSMIRDVVGRVMKIV